MKWDCGKTDLEKWHKWFAWHRVHIDDHDCRWLEYVARRGDLAYTGGYFWNYAPLERIDKDQIRSNEK